MGLWDKLKGGYNWVDKNVAGGRLPGGTLPGINSPAIGERVGDPSQYGGSYTTATAGHQPGAPFGTPPGAGRVITDPIVQQYTSDGSTRGGGIGRRVGQFVLDNPDLVLGAAGVAASAYGAHQQGKAEDRRLDLEDQQQQFDNALATRTLDQRQQAMDREYQQEVAERQRRRRAYRQILAGRDARGGQQSPLAGTPME